METTKQLILVVEDEIIIAHDIRQILEAENYEVIIGIRSADKAIRIIEERNPDLVLIDINLNQDKDGLNLGRYLLASDRIPYVYITSNTDRITIDEVRDTRPDGFIAKPFKPIDITTTVSIVLNNARHRAIDPKRMSTEPEDDVPFRIRETIQYINDNITEKIELADVVALTRWKTPHFIRLFTKHLGMTPYQYILRRKIERACVLLEETNLSSADIAFELGFHSYSNFNSAFKKIMGITSDSYRKKKQVPE